MYQKYFKRPVSFLLSLLGIILLCWLYLILIIAIKLDSPGPVFFKQKRVGKNKTYFNILKFRTMRIDTPHDVPTHLLTNPDQYITRVGRFLRKTSLDELPQLFNILKGDMDVIGPRPALWNQYDLIAERDKYGANDIRPGLTGWAQIHGRDELEIEEKARLDGYYVAHAGPVMDLKCFFGTITAVLKHEGVVEGGTGAMHEQKPQKILILANHYQTLRVFRRDLIRALAARGYEVVISIPPCEEEHRAELVSYGARVVFTEMERRGMNPLHDLALIRRYRKLLKAERPDRVIAYTIKPNIYGALTCRWAKIPCAVNITGLGSPFQSQNLTRKLVSLMYRVCCSRAEVIFFENEENRGILVRDGVVRAEQTAVLNGAGVNLEDFPAEAYPPPEEPLTFLFMGRVMAEKGVDELFSVIPRVREAVPEAQFDFIGWYEDDYKDRVEALEAQGLIRYYGFQDDVKPFIRRAHCVLLPSWHEGMSNTLLEGAAMARPLITNRIHGCMEAVIEGETGFLAEKQDAESLYQQIMAFAALPYEEKAAMGRRGRAYMEERFDKRKVVAATLDRLGL